MRFDSLRALTVLSLKRDKRSAFFSAFAVALGVSSLVFFVALGLGVGRLVREKIFPIDSRLVDVVPPTVSIGALLGGGKLDQATVDRLSALPGVAATHRKMNVRIPAVSRYDGDFFGSRIRMGLEILAQGVDKPLVERDVKMGEFKDEGPGAPISAVAASRVLEIYNKSFAPARKLPPLSPSLVIGFIFPVEFNRSFVAQVQPGPTTPAQVQVVGVSDRALLAGITIPLDTAIRLNKAAGVDWETFTGVTLEASDPSYVPALIDEVKKMGLQVDDVERRMAEQAGAAVAITTSALALLSALICLLAAVNIGHAQFASVRARVKEIGIFQAVGASRADVRNLVLAEAALLGLGGGLVGSILALAVAKLIDVLSASYLPPFPFKPDSYFLLPPWLLLFGVVLGLLAALAGAYLPSRFAASVDPARTLAG